MAAAEKKIRGTREWAVANIDCCTGCTHGCLYCYARYDAIIRKGISDHESWQIPKVLPGDVKGSYSLHSGQVMFPAHHDILPEILDDCLKVLLRLLEAGNRVLVVSKPHIQCIKSICDQLHSYRDKILFRFTITASDNDILRYWEPGAPSYEERFACLKYAYNSGYTTSISVEPMLDGKNIAVLVSDLAPFVNHSIWIGKMNKAAERIDMSFPGMEKELMRIQEEQSDGNIRQIYQMLKGNSLIRWKESIKEVVGLQLPEQAGMDV